MRVMMMAATIALSVALAACGQSKREERAAMEAQARASGFTPPAVTSRLDYGGMMERRFRRLDRNHDDTITADELPRQDSRIREFDTDANGTITSSEYSQGQLARFDMLDLNRDGTVTSDEEREWRVANPNRPPPPSPSNAEPPINAGPDPSLGGGAPAGSAAPPR
jgi:hypothetical protein